MNAREAALHAERANDALRARVDSCLIDFLASQRPAIAEADVRSVALVDEIDRTVRAGGKRLRPLFCYWGYRAARGGDGEAIVTVAASLEMLHTFAIVHDDLMDRSPLRRGQPSSFRRLAGALPDTRDPDRFGASAAVLVGDLAAAFADRMFFSSGFDGAALARAAGIFHAMRAEVIAGQYLDLLAAGRRGVTPVEARRISALKSGGYTVEKPGLIGAALAGAPPDLLEALSRFGAPLGEAFQLRDDVLGAFGDPEVTGKDAESDLREGKPTLLVAIAAERAAPSDRAFLKERLGADDLAADEVARIRDVFRATGALDETLRTIDSLVETAGQALSGARLPEEAAAALAGLAEQATARDR